MYVLLLFGRKQENGKEVCKVELIAKTPEDRQTRERAREVEEFFCWRRRTNRLLFLENQAETESEPERTLSEVSSSVRCLAGCCWKLPAARVN